MEKEIKHHSLIVELDRKQVNVKDPGDETPAIVFDMSRRYCSTYWVAINEEELLSDDGSK